MKHFNPTVNRRALPLGLLLTALLASGCSQSAPSGTPQTPGPEAASSAADQPAKATPTAPTGDQLSRAKAIASAMSDAELAGSVMIQTFSGADATEAAARAKRLHLGGTILMGENIPAGADGGVELVLLQRTAHQLASAAEGRPWRAIIAIDQEGGAVARLKAPLTRWPSPMAYGALGSPERAREDSQRLNSELAQLGITLNFATVADTTIGAADPTIGVRSYGEDPALVGTMATASVSGARDAGMLSAVKHFPGHGSVTSDSHVGLPVQQASLDGLSSRDWKPFASAIQQGASMVMMGHIEVTALDPTAPSSMSPAAYQALRNLGFKGVIVTDALNMGAIVQRYGADTAAVTALSAGADLLLMPEDAEKAHAAITAALADGSLSRDRVREAATRVIAQSLWQQESLVPSRTPPAKAGSGSADSQTTAAQAATVLTGQCSGPLVTGTEIQVTASDPAEGEQFSRQAEKAGFKVGSSGPVIALAGYGSAPMSGDVVVATDGPWVLGPSQGPVKIALYSSGPEAFSGLASVLQGKIAAKGRLTTAVDSYPSGTGCK